MTSETPRTPEAYINIIAHEHQSLQVMQPGKEYLVSVRLGPDQRPEVQNAFFNGTLDFLGQQQVSVNEGKLSISNPKTGQKVVLDGEVHLPVDVIKAPGIPRKNVRGLITLSS